MRNHIQLQILGNCFTINTDLPEEKIRRVESNLINQLDNLKKVHPNVSTVESLIFTNLNALEQNENLEQTVDDLRELTSQYLAEAKAAKKKADDLAKALYVANNELTTLRFKLGYKDEQ